MIPEYLTATEAQRLLDLGRARLHGPERLTTARAVYQWDAATACYVREPEVPCSPPATPAPPIWSAVGAAAVPRTPRPAIGQPRLGLSRLASLVAVVGLLLVLVGAWMALQEAMALAHYLAPTPVTDPLLRQVDQEIIAQAFGKARPTWFWVGLWMLGGGYVKPRQCLLYVYASLSRLDFQGFFENAILVFPGITGFPLSKKPTALMMHW